MKEGGKQRKTYNIGRLTTSIIVLMMGTAIALFASRMSIDLDCLELLAAVVAITAVFLLIANYFDISYLKNRWTVVDISLFLVLILSSLLMLVEGPSQLLLLYEFVLIFICLLRLYYICNTEEKSESGAKYPISSLIHGDYIPGKFVDDSSEVDDLFQMDPFFIRLADRICIVNSSSSNVISLIGPWGSGKTSAITITYKRYLEQKGYILINFDAWSDVGKDSAIIDLLDAIMVKLPNFTRYPYYRRRFVNNLVKSGNIWISLSGAFLDSNYKASSEDFRLELNAHLDREGSKLLVVIDNFDRASEKTVTELSSALNGLFRVSNATYITLYDSMNLNCYYDRNHMTKLSTHPMYMPKLRSDQYIGVLSLAYCRIFNLEQPDHYFHQVIEGIADMISTPREMIVVVNMMIESNSISNHSFNSVDFLAVRFLEYKNPELMDLLINNKRYVCSRYYMGYELNYNDNRKKFIDMLKNDYACCWKLISVLLQLKEFNVNSALHPDFSAGCQSFRYP